MNEYQKGREYVKNIKESFNQPDNQLEEIQENPDNAHMWEKTCQVAKDIKDNLLETSKSAYESTRDFVAGAKLDTRNLEDYDKNVKVTDRGPK